MADLAVQFGTESKFGTQTGWVAQSPEIDVSSDRASELGPAGDEATSKVHNEKTTCTQAFAAADATVAPTVQDTQCELLGSAYICTGISLSTKWNEMVKMSLTGHNHTTNAHTGDLKTCVHGQTLAVAFGSVDFLGGTAGSAASVDSSTLEISCDHDDRGGGIGENVVGENFHARMVATVTWVGVPSTASGEGWDKVSVVTRENNEGHLETIVRGEKALTMS
jgi:hypothetical protein